MPKLLDDRVVGGANVDVASKNYTGAAQGWVLTVNESGQKLVLAPQQGATGPTGPVGPPGAQGTPGGPGAPGTPGSLSAWGTFNLGSQTWISWFNIASVEVVQSGRLRFNFINAMPSDQYAVVATTWTPAFNSTGSTAAGNDNAIRVNNLTVNTFEITWLDRTNQTLENPSGVSFLVLAVPVPVAPAPSVVLPPPPPPPPPPDPTDGGDGGGGGDGFGGDTGSGDDGGGDDAGGDGQGN
jgi:hypothetical protein